MTFFRYLLPTAALALSLQATPLYTDVEAKGHAVVHILAANEDGEAVAEVVGAPLFAFRIENGKVSPGVFECEQKTETREKDSVSYPVVVLNCHDVTLVLVGVDLTTHK
jgi:hypothetical protein